MDREVFSSVILFFAGCGDGDGGGGGRREGGMGGGAVRRLSGLSEKEGKRVE